MEDCFLRGSGRMGWRQGMEIEVLEVLEVPKGV